MTGKGLGIAENGWEWILNVCEWLRMVENGWEWIGMTANGWECVGMVENHS